MENMHRLMCCKNTIEIILHCGSNKKYKRRTFHTNFVWSAYRKNDYTHFVHYALKLFKDPSNRAKMLIFYSSVIHYYKIYTKLYFIFVITMLQRETVFLFNH